MKRVILVGFEKSTSGDLRQVVGEENYIAAETLLPDAPLPSDPGNGHDDYVAQPTNGEDDHDEALGEDMGDGQPDSYSRHDPADIPSDDETLERCMEELLGAYYQYGGRTVWLTPFLRLLNDRFPYLDNRGRKRLVEDLQARKAIRIDKVEGDPYPYSVVEINWEDSWVRGLDEARGNS
jgi:hypothetical protein